MYADERLLPKREPNNDGELQSQALPLIQPLCVTCPCSLHSALVLFSKILEIFNFLSVALLLVQIKATQRPQWTSRNHRSRNPKFGSLSLALAVGLRFS